MFKEISRWTRRETALFLVIAAVPTVLYAEAGWKWLTIPWLPIALVGTAVAFITGFKNNTSYARLWEARQIYGSIVNTSRAFGLQVLDFPKTSDDPTLIRRRLIYRHIAWLTALRYQLREPRTWENMKREENVEYGRNYEVAEQDGKLEPLLTALIGEDETREMLAKKNRATQLITRQSSDLRRLVDSGDLTDLRFLEMERTLSVLYDAQGRCERIKSFPYPRQFATLNLMFVWLFIFLVPFGLLQEFQKMGNGAVWLTIPASVLVAWVFHTMDKIEESSENPFEGGPNDVPITSISRTIEIDLREMLGETELPPAITAKNNILM
jgi:putative membrane protein